MTLDALNFLQMILPAKGWYVGFVCKEGRKRQAELERVEELLAWLVQHGANGFDCYHAIASFHEEKRWNAGRKKWEVRSHENVAAVKCLIADIDTQESKPNVKYVDRIEAWRAGNGFHARAGIPPPLYVSSGGGLHCYWPQINELDLDQFSALGAALKRAALQRSLAIAPARSADASSILRTPGTHHWKSGRIVRTGRY